MNKPVAWMFEKDGAYMCFKNIDGVNFENGIPLFTHPVKENCCPDCGCHFTGEYPFNYTVKELTKAEGFALTDEEIAQVHKETFSKLATDLDFARAILRKAQEK